MKHYGMTTPELIGWLRLCRPGSVIGPQQNFLQDMEKRMFREGDAYRRRMAEAGLPTSPPGVAPRESEGTGTSDPGTPPTAGISSGMNGLSVSGRGTPTSPAGARAVGASPNTIRCARSRPRPCAVARRLTPLSPSPARQAKQARVHRRGDPPAVGLARPGLGHLVAGGPRLVEDRVGPRPPLKTALVFQSRRGQMHTQRVLGNTLSGRCGEKP